MYRQKDFDLLQEEIKNIAYDAEVLYKKNFEEPSLNEYEETILIIKKIVKDNDLIVYGGYAQNEQIEKKKKNDGFYEKWQKPDYEMYSPDPIRHGVEIADALHKKGFFNPKVDSAQHEGTYKIFCNLINIADISYVPKSVYDNLPTVKIDGIRMIHPHFMMTDAYRVYSDLLTSNFRLTKTFDRMSKLFNHYPLDDNAQYNIIKYDSSEKKSKLNDIKEFIRKKIIHHSKLIVIGHYAFNYYIKKTKLEKYEINDFPYYQLISTDYKNDAKKIYKILKNEFKSKLKVKEYYPLLSWWDRRMEFLYNNQVIIKLYSNNERCVPYNFSSKKSTNFSSFQNLIYFLFIDYNYALITKSNESYNFLGMLVKLFKARDSFLNEFDLTVLDESPFREFTTKCYGKPVESMRNSLLKGIERVKQGGKFKQFSYLAMGKKIQIPKTNFSDISGSKIVKEKDLTKIK
jgi:hypothetical protein